MPLDFIHCIPGVLCVLSLSHLAIMIFFPYWALFYHHQYHTLVVASPWIICVRKQCKFIKNLGTAELLSVIFFRLMLNQLKFLLKEFDLWVNWPVYLILASSLLYIGVGAFFFQHHVNSPNSQRGKQSICDIEVSPASNAISRNPPLYKGIQKRTSPAPKTSEVLWANRKSQSSPSRQKLRTSMNLKSFFPKSSLSCIPEQSESTLSAKSSLSYLGFKIATNVRQPAECSPCSSSSGPGSL
ncbi:uncharacterized protein LOC130453483 isoform X2 [Monodelphis domestica]|uniref:uncharacterized protein LOC130453483 isoform X2 n=1 Tax=Monodelphis domestica TaxID=13616 RepID=UPI0007B40A22|nr:uncharacterized protein LOC130453483 isoform X2 [Monodelphis domestica]